MEKQPWDDLDIEEIKKRLKAEDKIREDLKSVTFGNAVDLLIRINTVCDQELAHKYADNVLCSLLRSLGYNDIVDAYDEIGKWYS